MNSAYIDSLVDKIQDERTKEYFKEVLSSFYMENYRSAVVMLYSCVIHDLIYKLEELKELMNDASAEKILDKIKKGVVEENEKKKANYSAWEMELIEEMHKNKKIIELSTYNYIDLLKKERNMCAHPTLNENVTLYRPNKSTVHSLIINMLEGVFCKNYMIGVKDLFYCFIRDIEKFNDSQLDKDNIKNIIESKYLNRINVDIEYNFFKILWKFVFLIDNTECNKNRKVNFQIFKLIFSRHKVNFTNRITAEYEYYSKFINIGKENCMKCLIAFLNEYPKIFKLLSGDMQMLIKKLINNESKYKNVSLFLVSGEDVKQHIFNLGFLGDGNFDYLYEYVSDNFGDSEANNFLIDQFSKVNDFNDTRTFFDKYMEPRINDFDNRQLKEIINVMNKNNQIYNYGGIYTRVNTIANKIKEQEPNFDFLQYDNIKSKIELN